MPNNIFRFHSGKDPVSYSKYQDLALKGTLDLMEIDGPGDTITVAVESPDGSHKYFKAQYEAKDLYDFEKLIDGYTVYHFVFSVTKLGIDELAIEKLRPEFMGKTDFPEAVVAFKERIEIRGW